MCRVSTDPGQIKGKSNIKGLSKVLVRGSSCILCGALLRDGHCSTTAVLLIRLFDDGAVKRLAPKSAIVFHFGENCNYFAMHT